jgi:hypothetical protein
LNIVTYSPAGREALAAFLQSVSAVVSKLKRGLRSFFVQQTFKSHHDGNQSLLHVSTSKHMETIAIILVLVGVEKVCIEWLS